MTSIQDIGLSAAINLLTAFAFFVAFATLRLQPINDRVYFPKWYLKGIRGSPTHSGALVSKFVNLNALSYIKFLNWMPPALRMPEPELRDHAGLDSVVYKRIYLLGLKIFVPITLLAFFILVPVNWTGETLERAKDLVFSDIDKLSISNIPPGSKRFWAHVVMAYVFTGWTWYALYKEYKTIATMRLQFLASAKRRPDQFTGGCFASGLRTVIAFPHPIMHEVEYGCGTIRFRSNKCCMVLVRNVPPDPDESVSEHSEHFFCVNHPDHYLMHQVVCNANDLAKLVVKKKSLQNWLTYYQNKNDRNPSIKSTTKTRFCGLWGTRVDAVDYYTSEIEKLSKDEEAETARVLCDPKAIVPAAFVSFKSRWGAPLCAQTQQSSNPTIWLTEWAPEPRDVYWNNLAIPYIEITVRRLHTAQLLFFYFYFFFCSKSIESLIQGFLPGIALKIFLILLPTILMTMSTVEGFTSLSSLERRSAGKYHLFILVNVFLGSIITGTAFQQLKSFLNKPPTEIPRIVGESIPMKATFFITYIMVDGWAGIAAEILRLVPLIMFHLKNSFLVKTDQDRDEAMDPGSLAFPTSEPRIQFYFLVGFVYAAVTPILLPFIVVFFAFAYLVFRHQIINVYDQKYGSGAAFWPDVHLRIIIGLVISQLLLLGLLSTKKAEDSTPFLVALPILTIWFHRFCKGRFESAFVKFPLQDAMVKDTLERATEPNLNLRLYLQDAYIHSVFKGGELDRPQEIGEEDNSPLVPTKRTSNKGSSRYGSDVGSEAGC
ncbi:CSC1-like protein [Tripterygium wilfordii]|uniref:CSC1-like protein n=1 Tax=Tripterygium wilfordii TaxID=458696 RepID=A0A7J7CFM8_TRIWF|nr:CSC1-like protein [Tripterygium wilfordii]